METKNKKAGKAKVKKVAPENTVEAAIDQTVETAVDNVKMEIAETLHEKANELVGEIVEQTTPSAEEKVEKRGRPIKADSVRQKRLAEMKARAEANGGVVKLGRAVDMNSERQKRIAERNAKIASGNEPKRGRPKMIKTVEEITDPVVVEADKK